LSRYFSTSSTMTAWKIQHKSRSTDKITKIYE
jgi:hypothetical protein